MSRRTALRALVLGVCLTAFVGWRLHWQVHSYTGCVFTDPTCGSATGGQVDWVATFWLWSLVPALLLIIAATVDLILAGWLARRRVHEYSR